jgi:hypothetical protein
MFINNLSLTNSITLQVVARIWHNARPRKVGTLIWLTLNQGLPIGTWLQVMGDALPSHGGETQVRVSQSQVAELGLGSTLPASNSRKG